MRPGWARRRRPNLHVEVLSPGGRRPGFSLSDQSALVDLPLEGDVLPCLLEQLCLELALPALVCVLHVGDLLLVDIKFLRAQDGRLDAFPLNGSQSAARGDRPASLSSLLRASSTPGPPSLARLPSIRYSGRTLDFPPPHEAEAPV